MPKGKFDDLMKVRGRNDASRRNGEGRRITNADRAPEVVAGKRRNEEYRQVSAYIRKDTHRKVKMALLEEDREFSELVEHLLVRWLDSRT